MSLRTGGLVEGDVFGVRPTKVVSAYNLSSQNRFFGQVLFSQHLHLDCTWNVWHQEGDEPLQEHHHQLYTKA